MSQPNFVLRYMEAYNTMLQDASMSHKARGLLCCILSKPTCWTFNRADLCTPADSEASISAYLQELSLAWSLRWWPVHNDGMITTCEHQVNLPPQSVRENKP